MLLIFLAACEQEADNQKDISKNDDKVSSSTTSLSDVTDSLVLVLLKKERILECWHRSDQNTVQLISRQQIVGAPLASGPRLSDHSMHLPEGIYQFDSAIRLIFPNRFDQKKAMADNRLFKNKRYEFADSAMFKAISEVVKPVGSSKSSIIIVPHDLRMPKKAPACVFCPAWTNELYNNLKLILEDYQIGKNR